MKKTKKLKFEDLRRGQFFKWGRQIYQKDAGGYEAQQLTGRNIGKIDSFLDDDLVIPIKVKIVEVK